MRYRFVGIEAEISGVARMDRYGQVVELPAGMEAEAAAALLLPEDEFNEIFESVDVEQYQMVAGHDGAPLKFQECKRAANEAVARFRSKIKGGK
ncbi:MAG: hypothetical protein ABFD89_09040 [Bryobacteraceae bacterium]